MFQAAGGTKDSPSLHHKIQAVPQALHFGVSLRAEVPTHYLGELVLKRMAFQK